MIRFPLGAVRCRYGRDTNPTLSIIKEHADNPVPSHIPDGLRRPSLLKVSFNNIMAKTVSLDGSCLPVLNSVPSSTNIARLSLLDLVWAFTERFACVWALDHFLCQLTDEFVVVLCMREVFRALFYSLFVELFCQPTDAVFAN